MSTPFENSARAKEQIRRIEESVASGKLDTFFSAKYPSGSDNYRLCHLVLQGGGTLGIAHLGFIRGLEIANVRFAGLAGTSAGAIVSLLIAAARKDAIEDEIASQLLPILQTMPAAAFMDGPYFARRFVKFALDKRRSNFLDYVLPAISSIRLLLNRYGLNHGYRFEDWLATTLSRKFGLDTQRQLNDLLDAVATKLEEHVTLTPHPDADSTASRSTPLDLLHITATAMPLGLKIVFPRQAALLHEKYADRSPGLYARASMSVPLFFEPRDMQLDTSNWQEFVDKLRNKNAYSADVIKRMNAQQSLSFIDGGLLSNFPIDAFAQFKRAPDAKGGIPTIGVALFSSQTASTAAPRGSVRAFAGYAGAAINAMRHMRDREGFERATQINLKDGPTTEVIFVDTGPHNWLNFNLPPEDMRDLFVRGLGACADFLERLTNPRDD